MSIYDSTQAYPRDLKGYGRDVPHARWPNGARIAVQFVLNYEEGGENCVLHGDPASEQFLSEMFNPAAFEARHISMEGIYEYGSRAGVWRILREFERRDLPLTVATLPIFSKAYYKNRDFEATTLEPPLGSGPYKVGAFEQGRYVAFSRVPDYWAKDMPIAKGQNNFDTVRFEYFGDPNAAFEGFKGGEGRIEALLTLR